MIRCVLLVLLVGAVWTGEASPLEAAHAARAEAEAQLATTRTAIANAQADRLARLQRAIAETDAARQRLAIAEAERVAATTALERRRNAHDHALTQARQLADRAVVAARPPEREQRALANATPSARIDAAIAAINRRINALPGRLALRRCDETVVGRDGAVANVPVLRLGEARAVALGSNAATRGLLEPAADGSSWLVVGPPLPPIAIGVIPFDAAGSAAHQPEAVHRSLREWLAAGRAFIWPILAVLAVGLAIIVERLIAFSRRRVDHARLVAVAARLGQGDAAGADAMVADGATPLDRVLAAGLAARRRPREAREAAVEQVLLAESAQLSRGLTAIAVLAGVAPLLGLLGTVTGMIDMFSVIAAQGSGNAKGLSGGISEALICTQAGMLVAIPLLLAHAWLSRLADRRTQLLEEAACGVLGLAGGEEPT